MFKTVVIEKKDNIAILKLNRPESNNSFDAEMILEAGRAIEELSCDTGVRVIIITGLEKFFGRRRYKRNGHNGFRHGRGGA